MDLDLTSECNCSICTKKGIIHAIIAPEKFELVSGEDALLTYTFNTGIAKHTFCRVCIHVHAAFAPDRSARERAASNDVDLAAFARADFTAKLGSDDARAGADLSSPNGRARGPSEGRTARGDRSVVVWCGCPLLAAFWSGSCSALP